MSMFSKVWSALMVAVVFVVVPASGSAQESDYPSKPIQVTIPFKPGAVNTACTVLGEKLAEYLGQPIVLINRPGAGGAIGAADVANAAADGYSLLAAVPAFITLPLTKDDVSYKRSEFVPIGQFARFSHYLVVKDDFPAKTLADLVKMISQRPGEIFYGGSGVGGTAYLLIETLKRNRKLNTQFVPYTGETGAIAALLGGHIQFVVVSSTAIFGQIKGGAVRALATFSSDRDPLFPELQTATEQGFPELVATGYFTILAPAKTPSAIVKKLEAGLERATKDKGVQQKLLSNATSAYFRSSADTVALFGAEERKWSDMGKAIGIGQ